MKSEYKSVLTDQKCKKAKRIDFETVSIILLHSIYWLIPTAGFTAR